MAIAERKAWKILRTATARIGASSSAMPLVILIAATSMMMGVGCGTGYKEKAIPAKEFTPQERGPPERPEPRPG